MTGRITILVGTMSGTAEMVADALLEAIEAAGLTGRILRMEKARVEALSAGGVWLVCTSTYGTGEVPDNAKALYAALGQQRPDLSKARYGVVALGDSIYPNTFCFGGKRFDELLAALGARRIGERLENDSRSPTYPDDTAREWLEGWLETLRQSSDEADGATTEGAEISR
jgi:MioC protein